LPLTIGFEIEIGFGFATCVHVCMDRRRRLERQTNGNLLLIFPQ